MPRPGVTWSASSSSLKSREVPGPQAPSLAALAGWLPTAGCPPAPSIASCPPASVRIPTPAVTSEGGSALTAPASSSILSILWRAQPGPGPAGLLTCPSGELRSGPHGQIKPSCRGGAAGQGPSCSSASPQVRAEHQPRWGTVLALGNQPGPQTRGPTLSEAPPSRGGRAWGGGCPLLGGKLKTQQVRNSSHVGGERGAGEAGGIWECRKRVGAEAGSARAGSPWQGGTPPPQC